MTINTTNNSLLDSASIRQCEQLAQNADLKGKRAKALLAINNGDSHSMAAEKSGLTAGQVGYMVTRFKKIGMELFNTTASTKKTVTKKPAVKKAVTKKASTKKATSSAATKQVKKEAEAAPASDTTEAIADAEKESTGDTKKSKDKKKKKLKKDKKSSKNKKDKKDKKLKKSKKDSKKKKSKKNKK